MIYRLFLGILVFWVILQVRISFESKQLKNLTKFVEGNYVDLYLHPTDPNKIIKQIKLGKPIKNWDDRDHQRQKEMKEKSGWVASCFQCHRQSCTLMDLIAWTIMTAGMWQSNLNKQKLQNQTGAIAKISEINPKTLSWTEEKVTSKGIDQFLVTDQEQVKEQLTQYSELLKQHNLQHYDAHIANFGIREDKNKEIVTFDGEVLDPFFVWVQQMMMGHFFYFGDTTPYRDFEAIQFNGLYSLTPIAALKQK